MKNLFVVCSSVLLLSVLSLGDCLHDKQNRLFKGKPRLKRSVIHFPSGLSDKEGANRPRNETDLEANTYGIRHLATSHSLSDNATLLTNNSATNFRKSRMEVGINNGLNARSYGAYNYKRTNKFDSPSRRRTSMSIIGAALNFFNPLNYVKGSLVGIKNVLIQNIEPFRKRFDDTHKLSSHDKFKATTNTHHVITNPKQNLRSTFLPANTQHSHISSSITAPKNHSRYNNFKSSFSSFRDGHKGLNLKIPAKFSSYSALQVNVKPNGELDITPINRNQNIKLIFEQHGTNYTNSHLNNADHLGLNSNSHTSNYGTNNPRIIIMGNSDRNTEYMTSPNIIKLVTDKPLVVNSIQDIYNLQNKKLINEQNFNHFSNTLYPKLTSLPTESAFKILPSGSTSKILDDQSKVIAKPDHIYLLPVKINNKKNYFKYQNYTRKYKRKPIYKYKNDPSQIYHIDITIPDDQQMKPFVRHRYVPIKKNPRKFYGRRTKRNAKILSKKLKELRERRSRFLDYNGWEPLDVIDPMADQPTLEYKPPTHAKVKFGVEPNKRKPLFPILPKNPPVYVIRAEPLVKKVHSIYGTENIDYLHVNHEENSAKAFSAFGKTSIENSESVEEEKKSTENEWESPFANIYPDIAKNKSDKIKGDINKYKNSPRVTEAPKYSFSDILSRVNSNNSKVIENTAINEAAKVNKDKKLKLSDSEFIEKTLDVDNVSKYGNEMNYYKHKLNTYDYDNAVSAQNDPFASIISPKDRKLKKPTSSEEIRNDYYGDASENIETKSVRRAPLYKLLKNFSGMKNDPYIVSASENKENSYIDLESQSSLPLIPSEGYPTTIDRNVERSVDKFNGDSWYLIETRAKVPSILKRNENKIKKKKEYVKTEKAHDITYDNKSRLKSYFNSLEPPESITANSLSDLLQIFKYVTTPSPYGIFKGAESLRSKLRTFRYTTETPDMEKIFTTFRYTIPDSQSSEVTEPTVVALNKFDDHLNTPLNDSAIETNSLDGYLFADSVNAVEYIRPENHLNKIPNKSQESKKLESISIDTKMDYDASKRGKMEEPILINIKRSEPTTSAPLPYFVHEGHSNVKVFGSNSASRPIITTQKPKISTPNHIILNDPYILSSTIAKISYAKPEEIAEPQENKLNNSIPSPMYKYLSISRIGETLPSKEKFTINDIVKNRTKLETDDTELTVRENPLPVPTSLKTPTHELQTEENISKNGLLSFDLGRLSDIFSNYFSQKSEESFYQAQYVGKSHESGRQYTTMPQINLSEDPNTDSAIEYILSNPLDFLTHLRKLRESNIENT